MEHKFITSANGSTHYWVNHNVNEGSKWIVFTHGLTANHIMFEKQVSFFREKFSILTWDVPLHGLSRPYRDFSYANTANELNSIFEEEGIEDAILVGMSMGGYPSQIFADQFPDKVSGFVALGTTPFGVAYYSKTDIWWLKQVEPMSKWIPEKILRASMAKSVSKTKYSQSIMQEMLAPLSKAEIVEQMGVAYGKFVEENRDMQFDFPVLILVGEHDSTGKVQQYCEEWAKNEGFPLVIIRDAAHLANCDNPKQVNEEIEEFISKI